MSNINNWISPPAATPPPTWAQVFNTSFRAVDSHDHTDGSGIQLSFDVVTFINSFDCQTVTLCNQLSFSGTPSPINQSVYSDGMELYVQDGFGRNIKITSDGNVNVTTLTGGGFSGDYVSAGAEVVFTSGSNTYEFFGPSGVSDSFVICGQIDKIASLALPAFVNVGNIELTCTGVTGNFTPAATNTGFVITGNSLTGHAVDLAPFVQLTTSNTASKQSTYYFQTTPPSLQYYSVFLPATHAMTVSGSTKNFVNSIQQFKNRNAVDTDSFVIPSGVLPVAKYPATFGGISQSAPIITTTVFPTSINARVQYSDNLILQSSIGDNFWNNDLVLSMKFISS